jgi:hypothetical protein
MISAIFCLPILGVTLTKPLPTNFQPKSGLPTVQTKQFESLKKISLESNQPFDNAVPHPESILGYTIGSRITTYREQEQVLDAIYAKSNGMAIKIKYGKSNQNFPLRVYAISTPKNIARWQQIQKALETSAQTGVAPAADIPTIVWVNETIHGNEPASFEAGMMLFYNLIAGKGAFKGALDNVVVILNPCYNPDGHERFAVGYNSYARGGYEPGNFDAFEHQILWGRYNQYRFDMNRDRVSFSQVETQQEVKLMQSLRPQIYLDQHGQVSNYFFPPNPMSINSNVDRERLNKWTDILGRECASAFDNKGWSYFIREDFDFYYPGYLDTHTTMSGAIGITHETDGGKVLFKTRDDGSVVSLREGAAKHLTTALAVIKTAAARKSELFADWTKYKKAAVSGSHAGNFKRVIVTSKNPAPLNRLKAQLEKTGIKSGFASNFKQKAHDFWSDKFEEIEFKDYALVVDMAQEFGPIAKTLFEINSDFEKEFIDSQQNKKKTAPEGETYPGQESTEFYDLTGWSLPYAHNLQAYWCEETPTLNTVQQVLTKPATIPDTSLGFVIRYEDQNDVLAGHDLLAEGVRVSIMNSNMAIGGTTYKKGSFVIFNARNGDDLKEKIAKVQKARSFNLEALPTSYPDSGREGPGNRLSGLSKPNIGIIFGNGANGTGFGPTWYLMDNEYHVPFTSLNASSVNNIKLGDYTSLVCPSGSGLTSNTKVRDWVKEGGVLVLLGENPSGVATFESNNGTRSIPGTIFRAQLEKRSILASGYETDTIAVPVDGDNFFKAKKEGGAVVKFSNEDKSKALLTGWSWGEETEKSLRGSVWMHDEPLGKGHIIWFSFDPNERAMWPGLSKLFLNSLIIMPGN